MCPPSVNGIGIELERSALQLEERYLATYCFEINLNGSFSVTPRMKTVKIG